MHIIHTGRLDAARVRAAEAFETGEPPLVRSLLFQSALQIDCAAMPCDSED